MFSKNEQQDKSLWTEDPKVAYQNFMTHGGNEPSPQGVAFFGSSSKELQLHAVDGEFLSLQPLLGHPLYCSKITIRNIKNAELIFQFEDGIIPGILGTNCDDYKAARSLQIAYRNIVPSIFSQATQLAGPMGYHEYIIDGSHYSKQVPLSFIANSDFRQTPVKIVLENCEGSCIVTGLDDRAAAKIFENKCISGKFSFFNTPPQPKDESNNSPAIQMK